MHYPLAILNKMYYNIIYVPFGIDPKGKTRKGDACMFIIGITGPSGAGKGVLSDILFSFGMSIIDADKVYHDIIAPPSDCLGELAREFGDCVLNSDGTLDRRALSGMVFGEENKERLLTLNAITHKYVVEKIRDMVSTYKAQGKRYCVIDAPLLIESGLCEDCDITISVLADKEVRIKRISNRDGITLDAASARINSQKSEDFYISGTDFVIYNDSNIEEMRDKVTKLLCERKCDCV